MYCEWKTETESWEERQREMKGEKEIHAEKKEMKKDRTLFNVLNNPLMSWSHISRIQLFENSRQKETVLLLLFSHSGVSDCLATPQTIALQAPLSMRFPRKESWSGLLLPSSGHLPDAGIDICLLLWQVGFFLSLSYQGSPKETVPNDKSNPLEPKFP